MLRLILHRFITVFYGEPDASFWSHIMYRCDHICGQDDFSGWITAFCVWSNKGVWKGGSLPDTIPLKLEYAPVSPLSVAPAVVSESDSAAPTTRRLDKVIPKWLRRHSQSLMSKEKVAGRGASSEGSVMVHRQRLPFVEFLNVH